MTNPISNQTLYETVDAIVDSMYEDQEEHYDGSGQPYNHIYPYLCTLKSWRDWVQDMTNPTTDQALYNAIEMIVHGFYDIQEDKQLQRAILELGKKLEGFDFASVREYRWMLEQPKEGDL